MNVKSAYRRAAVVWLALLVLLALTCASAFLSLGPWNAIANFAISAMKALLVAWFFMNLAAPRPVFRIVAIAALFMLALLIGLSLADYTTRTRYPAPWQAPQGALS